MIYYALFILLIVILAALIFEYTNGFQDAANAIATVVSTKVLSPRQAILYGACNAYAIGIRLAGDHSRLPHVQQATNYSRQHQQKQRVEGGCTKGCLGETTLQK